MLEGRLTGTVKGERGGSSKDADGKQSAPSFTPDPSAPYAHPYYWAPFILMGNWL
jgi:CHAT domain-containing protein